MGSGVVSGHYESGGAPIVLCDSLRYRGSESRKAVRNIRTPSLGVIGSFRWATMISL